MSNNIKKRYIKKSKSKSNLIMFHLKYMKQNELFIFMFRNNNYLYLYDFRSIFMKAKKEN